MIPFSRVTNDHVRTQHEPSRDIGGMQRICSAPHTNDHCMVHTNTGDGRNGSRGGGAAGGGAAGGGAAGGGAAGGAAGGGATGGGAAGGGAAGGCTARALHI